MLVKLGILTLVVNKQILRKAWPPNGIACSNSCPSKQPTSPLIASPRRHACRAHAAAPLPAPPRILHRHRFIGLWCRCRCLLQCGRHRLGYCIGTARIARAALRSTWREAAKLPPRVMRWLPSVSQPSRQALPSVSGPHSPGAGKALANMHTHLQTRFGMHASLLFHTRDTASAPCAKTQTPRPSRGVGDRALLALHHCVRCTRRIVLMRFTARQASAYRSCNRLT